MIQALIIVASVAGVLLVHAGTRAIAGRDIPDATRELAGIVGLRIATLHGLIIALVFAQLALVYRNLETEITQEAQTVGSIYADARRHGGTGADEIAAAARDYVDIVLDVEWRASLAGDPLPDDAHATLDRIYDLALALPRATPAEEALRDGILQNVRRLGDLRFAREGQVDARKGLPFWFAAVSGLVLMSACFFAVPPTGRTRALLGAFGLYNGIVLALIHSYTNPFMAPGALQATAFERVRTAMGG